jgi:hypothetical protein
MVAGKKIDWSNRGDSGWIRMGYILNHFIPINLCIQFILQCHVIQTIQPIQMTNFYEACLVNFTYHFYETLILKMVLL